MPTQGLDRRWVRPPSVLSMDCVWLLQPGPDFIPAQQDRIFIHLGKLRLTEAHVFRLRKGQFKPRIILLGEPYSPEHHPCPSLGFPQRSPPSPSSPVPLPHILTAVWTVC